MTDEVFCLRVVEDTRSYKYPPCQIESVGVGALDDPLPNMLFAQQMTEGLLPQTLAIIFFLCYYLLMYSNPLTRCPL